MIRSEVAGVHGTCKRDSRRFHDSIDPLELARERARKPARFLQPEPSLAVIPAFLAIQLSLELFIATEMNYTRCKF